MVLSVCSQDCREVEPNPEGPDAQAERRGFEKVFHLRSSPPGSELGFFCPISNLRAHVNELRD